MKKVLTLTLALFALPLVADEPAKKDDPKKTAPQATVLTQPAPAATVDSPLVAASKRANRKGKKPKNVITNETLKQPKNNAHITTTTNPGPVPLVVDPVGDARRAAELQEEKVAAAEKVAADEETRKKKEAARRRLATAADTSENDYVDTQSETELAEAAKDAEKTGEKKPPQ